MRILMVASEAAPFAKTGGLADVVAALPRALARLGHSVDVVIPRYRGITAGDPIGRVTVPLGGRIADADVHAVVDAGVRTVLVGHAGYFDRDHIYGAAGHDYPDNPERFAFLSRAALEWAASSGERYDAIHAHDWQAGLVPVFLRGLTAPALRGVPTVFTIHNLAYQGLCDASWLPRLGLGSELMSVNGLEFWNQVSLLKGGIVFSRRITTVSPRYAQEIQTPGYGCGLDGVLRGRVLDVAVDVRRGSPTFGKHVSTELSAESGHQVYIPAGFAHGFLTLEDDVVVMYKVSDFYSAAHDGGIRWNDPDVAFPWPIKAADVITSDKDRRLPLLAEFASPFAYDGQPLAPLTVTDFR